MGGKSPLVSQRQRRDCNWANEDQSLLSPSVPVTLMPEEGTVLRSRIDMSTCSESTQWSLLYSLERA